MPSHPGEEGRICQKKKKKIKTFFQKTIDKYTGLCYTIIRKGKEIPNTRKEEKMYEYEIYNKTTDKTDIIYGYFVDDAFRRNPDLNPAEWVVILANYVD